MSRTCSTITVRSVKTNKGHADMSTDILIYFIYKAQGKLALASSNLNMHQPVKSISHYRLSQAITPLHLVTPLLNKKYKN